MTIEYDVTRETYDKIASGYSSKHYGDTDFWNDCYKDMQKYLQKGTTILDAGCGPGRDVRYFLDHGYNIIGIDFSDGMLEEARKNVPEGDFQKMSISELEFRDDYFEAVWNCASLQHLKLEDGIKSIKEFNRVLKPGGFVFVAVPEGTSSGMEDEALGKPRFFTRYQLDQLRNILIENGFEVLKTYSKIAPNKRPWIALIAKKN
ncbi:MAG: class I SAM-dependent methyltransferase [Candidatus Micrarchaeales archaeon]